MSRAKTISGEMAESITVIAYLLAFRVFLFLLIGVVIS